MKSVMSFLLALIGGLNVRAETVERTVFDCSSQVSGFESFQIIELKETQSPANSVHYQVRTGILFFEEIWEQKGEAVVAAESPVFQSEFARPYTPPLFPPEPVEGEQPPAVEPGRELLIFVAVNRSGSGSLSVDSDLAPLQCLRLND